MSVNSEAARNQLEPDSVAKRLASLSPAKRALFELEVRKRKAKAQPSSTIPRRSSKEYAPLSFAQERLWFLNQLEPQSVAYNEPKVIRFQGPLDLAAVQEALTQLVTRHEVLRTTFVLRDGRPEQHIHDAGQNRLTVIDLTTEKEDSREARAQDILAAAIRRPFDLSSDLMLRVSLIKLSGLEHILILVTHHIASDGWSMGILAKEFGEFYTAFAAGRVPSIPDLPIQYADYAEWQRQTLAGEILQTQLSFWRRQLSGVPVLEVPPDRPRPSMQRYEGDKQEFSLPEDLCEQLRQLSSDQGVTLYMTLLAALQVLLHRYTGLEDIALGSPIAGRNHPDLEGLIGFFINVLVLRTDLSGNPCFRDVLRNVRETVWTALQHQDLPFERLVADLQPERNLGRNPLFEVVFAFQNMPEESLDLPGLSATTIEMDSGTAKFDLVLTVSEQRGLVGGKLDYRTDLFDASTIRRFLECFELLLRSIVANPDAPVSALSLLEERERDRLLFEWNRTAAEYPRNQCIHELFQQQVRSSPDAVAIAIEEEQLTYRELNGRANALAHYLNTLGLEPKSLIGVCMERSMEMVISLLGILKSGHAYLPLDPEYPGERLSFMLQDSRVPVVVTVEFWASRLRNLGGARMISWENDLHDLSGQSDDDPDPKITPHDLAYVMYTSGSTGKPKGVEIPHRGVVRLLFGARYVELGRNETLLHFAPISFDASTFEIWGALLHGGKCVVFPRKLSSPAELVSILKKHNVSTLWLTASLFNLVIDQAPNALSNVRQLLIGGEALSVRHVRRALALLPGTKIINGYGPTESTTFACTYPIPRTLGKSIASIPIGRPVANTTTYILDSHLSPVPVGVPGELYIGGDGLARGYLNRQELTAERFISNPFTGNTMRRLYRTGDRVRYLQDGNIEFLGRLDDQVKIRGFRIEPGEIEAVLKQQPAIRDSLVMFREHDRGEKSLIAYVVTADRSRLTASDLRQFLKQKLPDYMIPSGFVLLREWPLTPNGKVDRRALLATELASLSETSFVAPRTPDEERLEEIWRKILSIDRISVTHDFFDLGGHSLLAVRLISEIQEAFGSKLSLADFFQEPTIERFARFLSSGGRSSVQWKSLLPIQTSGSQKPFFWVHGEESNRVLPRYLSPDQPLYGILHQAHDGLPAQHTSVESIAAHYLSEMKTVQPDGPYRIGGYCFGAMIAFEMAHQLEREGQDIELLFLLDPSPLLCRPSSPSARNGRAVLRAGAPATTLGGEMSRHLKRVGSLKLKDAIEYVFVRLKNKAIKMFVPKSVMTAVKNTVCRFYLALGRRLPFSLRSFYILKIYVSAMQRYSPRNFEGSAVVFMGEEEFNFLSGAPQLPTKTVHAYSIPGDHRTILREPQVSVWAEQLNHLLQTSTREE